MRYEYTIHREADGPGLGPPPEFSWLHGPWSKCTVTCGTGAGPEPLGRDARLSLQLTTAHSRGHHEPGISPSVKGG